MTEFRNLVCAAPLWLNFPAFLTAECSHVTNILVNGKKVDMIGSIFLVFFFFFYNERMPSSLSFSFFDDWNVELPSWTIWAMAKPWTSEK